MPIITIKVSSSLLKRINAYIEGHGITYDERDEWYSTVLERELQNTPKHTSLPSKPPPYICLECGRRSCGRTYSGTLNYKVSNPARQAMSEHLADRRVYLERNSDIVIHHVHSTRCVCGSNRVYEDDVITP